MVGWIVGRCWLVMLEGGSSLVFWLIGDDVG